MRNVVGVWVLLCVIGGCRPEFIPDGPSEPAVGPSVMDAGPRLVDAAMLRDAPIGVETSDAATTRAGDATATVVSRPARGFQVDPASCEGDWVDVPSDFIRPGETLWQLCYTTPIEETSTSPLAHDAPDIVVLTQRSSWTGAATDVVWIVPDESYAGWTVSAVISVPNAPAGYPLFNARNEYDHDVLPQSLWAVGPDGDIGHYLETHGRMTIWRVRQDGHREFHASHMVLDSCEDQMFPDASNGGSFLPEGETCPDEYYLCGPGRFSCDYEP